MKRAIWIALLGACISLSANGQAITILGNPTMSVLTASDHNNGVTISHNTLNFSSSPGNSTLSVRASGNLTSGINSIPVGSLFLQITAPAHLIGSEIQLSTTNQNLFAYLFQKSAIKEPVTIRYRLTGGSHLYQPAGTYTTTLTFTVTQL